jgi:hypothetical protein
VSGNFGSINLLGPRHSTSVSSWNAYLTLTQLRFEFIDGLSGDTQLPLKLGRTYVSFFDFDMARQAGTGTILDYGHTAVEMIEVGPQATLVEKASQSDVVALPLSAVVRNLTDEAQALLPNASSDTWSDQQSRMVYIATQRGIGADNPIDSYYLSGLQARRAITILLENASSIQVRIAVFGCCAT